MTVLTDERAPEWSRSFYVLLAVGVVLVVGLIAWKLQAIPGEVRREVVQQHAHLQRVCAQEGRTLVDEQWHPGRSRRSVGGSSPDYSIFTCSGSAIKRTQRW